MDPTRSAALGGPRERRFVGPAAGPHGGAHAFRRPHGGHPSAHSPRAPCSSPTDALAWPKPDLSPPADFDGDGILALFALAAGPCRVPPRAPCSSSTDALAWPKPGLSPPADFDGDGTLAFVALAGSSCLRGDGAAGACREGTSGRVSCPGEEAVYQDGRGGTSSGGATQAPSGATSPCALRILY